MKIQLKSIMCSTDFSDFSNHAVLYGAALAKEFNAKLYVCHIVDLPTISIYEECIADPLEQENRFINYAGEEIGQLLAEHNVDWEPLIQCGHPSHEVVRMAEEKDVDLTIAATHGRSGLKRLIMGSVTEHLMRTLPCPLLALRSPEKYLKASLKQGIGFKRILVGYDFSPDSDLAFQYGLSLAQEFQSELHLVHVIEPSAYKDLLDSSLEPDESFLQPELKKKLKKMVPKEAQNWCAPQITILAGLPYDEVTKYAVVNDIDLIVLGVRGHGLTETLLIGSTTDRVARQALCPVLSVHPTIQKSGNQT